jgi:hypothetical protein
MNMIGQGGALCFGGDGFERKFGAAIRVIVEEEVVCMIVNDGEGLNEKTEIVQCCSIEVFDLVQ